MNQEGRLHPISIAIREIADIFGRMGFGIAYGPEMEDEWHNFTALNVPEDHPARDMQDTFWLKPASGEFARPDSSDESGVGIQGEQGNVLRTHTTSVTMRKLEEMAKTGATEMRMINPGKVFRNEATDMTHEAQFYQLDGFAVGPAGSVTLAHLKGTFDAFYREYFGPNTKVRFRPSFFGFTEPSVEIDVWFEPAGKEGKWLETAGAGMLHPNVLRNAGLDPEKVQGFAFGGGLERLLMVKYGIPDVRLFHSGDIRFNYAFDADTK
ncbi:MAG: phenylalanine--tRNA ligase subunit alpha [Candidatus Paceibacterota bacterium]|jgi:phenylalanyl-tRNA synthetase alpha chain